MSTDAPFKVWNVKPGPNHAADGHEGAVHWWVQSFDSAVVLLRASCGAVSVEMQVPTAVADRLAEAIQAVRLADIAAAVRQ